MNNSTLDMMIEAGIDGWQGIQPKIGMTLPALQECYGKLCFWGGVDMDRLVAGTEAHIAEEVRIEFDSAPREGGLVLTVGNSVMVDVQQRNYMAMMHIARTYNLYQQLA